MRIFKKTDIGLRRTTNQDFCDGGVFSDNAAWIIVCDGMGGANGGNIASALATQKIKDVLTEGYGEKIQGREMEDLLIRAVEEGNKAVFDAAQKDPSLSGMGTTVVAAVLKDGKAHIVHVGDSRAYIIGERQTEQITIDHSMVQELLMLGQITAEEARNHPQRNIITRALGIRETVNVEYDCVTFKAKDKFLACTDGMSNYVDEEDIYALSKDYSTKDMVDKLVDLALEAGGSDNITVVLADCEND